MKDDVKGKIISEFAGLKSKMYSLVTLDNEEIKIAKRVNKNVVETKVIRNLLMFCLIKTLMRCKMKRIQSKLHRIGIYDICKISLLCFDDKKYILGDSSNKLAYFHKNVKS